MGDVSLSSPLACTVYFVVLLVTAALGSRLPLPNRMRGTAAGCALMLAGLIPVFFALLLFVLEGLGPLGVVLSGVLGALGFAAVWFGGRILIVSSRQGEQPEE